MHGEEIQTWPIQSKILYHRGTEGTETLLHFAHLEIAMGKKTCTLKNT